MEAFDRKCISGVLGSIKMSTAWHGLDMKRR